MLSHANSSSQNRSISEYLTRTAPGARASQSQDISHQFSAALENSLEELGFKPDQIHVTIREAESQISQEDSAKRQFLITLEAPLETSEESESPEIPPYDPKVGPLITNDMWTEEMLTGDLTQDFMRNVVDPAALLNARLEATHSPTNASVVNVEDGSSQPLNASHLSTMAQAEAMLERLNSLGINTDGIKESVFSSGPFSYDFAGDERRIFEIAGMNVGQLVERYSKYSLESADNMTLAEHSAA